MSGIKSPRCGRGHKWDGIRGNGQRYCKKCKLITQAANRKKLAAQPKVSKRDPITGLWRY
jgi:hypothetical protein